VDLEDAQKLQKQFSDLGNTVVIEEDVSATVRNSIFDY